MKERSHKNLSYDQGNCKKICYMYQSIFPLETDNSEEQATPRVNYNQFNLNISRKSCKNINNTMSCFKLNQSQPRGENQRSYLNCTPNLSVSEDLVNSIHTLESNLSEINELPSYSNDQEEQSRHLPFIGDENELNPPQTLSSFVPNKESIIESNKEDEFLITPPRSPLKNTVDTTAFNKENTISDGCELTVAR